MNAVPKAKREPYFPFTQALYDSLIAANLTAAEWRFWGYLVTLDPFGDGAKYDPSEAMLKCGLSKSTYFSAKAKLQKLGFDFKDGETKVRNAIAAQKRQSEKLDSQSEKLDSQSEKLDSQSEKLDSQSEKLDSQSEKLDSAIYIDRACDQTISNSFQTYPNSFQTAESVGGRENFASLSSEPSEPASTTQPVESLSPVNSTPVAASQVAEGQFSAAASQQNFSKFSDPVGDRFAQGLPPWKASDGTINPEFLEWVAKGHDPKTSVMPRKSWAKSVLRNNPERASDLWSEYQEHLQAQSRSPLAQAEPLVAPDSNPFGVPTSTDEEADRIRGMARAAKAAGRPLSPAILKRAQELGVELGDVAIAPAPVSPIGEIPPIPPIPPRPVQVAQPAIAPEPAKLQSFAELQSVFSGLGLSMSVVDTSELLAEIQVMQQCLGWSQAELDYFVESEFKVRSTHHLEDEELERLLKMLKTQQLAGGVA
jgi:hypothetical protein